MAAPIAKRFSSLNSKKTAFFLCDMQERFRPAIGYFDEITQIANRMINTAKIMSIPLIVTEQYPKGLLHTITELDISHAAGVFPKTKFSMVIPEVEEKLKELFDGMPESVVLFGIEAHVCVQQTALDLENKGVEVHVVADATSSRFQGDRMYAFDRLRHAGVCITTSESIIFQLLGDKDHEKFKELQGWVKNPPPDTGIMNKL